MDRHIDQKTAISVFREFDAYRIAKEKERNLAFYNRAKRVMDITGALLGLILFAPLFVIVAILIKLESPRGPVFYSQIRIGKDMKPFRMYKFRSMVPDAEQRLPELLSRNEIEGAMFKIKDDPRITRVGKWIRKTSIDELPQLFNVLKGDMSLVGPRPPLPREVEEYTELDKLRLTVPGGCTGLWQVNGRNHLNFRQMVELDLEYIRNRSLLQDIKIILKTFKVLLGAKDAY